MSNAILIRNIFKEGLPQPFLVNLGVLAALVEFSKFATGETKERYSDSLQKVFQRPFIKLLETKAEDLQKLDALEAEAAYKLFMLLGNTLIEEGPMLSKFTAEVLLGQEACSLPC